MVAVFCFSACSLSAPLPSECNCPTSPLSPSAIDYVLSMTVERQLTAQECAFICNPSPPVPSTSENINEDQGTLITLPDHQHSENSEPEAGEDSDGNVESHIEKSPNSQAQHQPVSFASSDGFVLKDFSAEAASRNPKIPSHAPIRPTHAFSSSSLPLSAPPSTSAIPIFALITAIFILVVCLIEYSRRHTTGVSWAPRARHLFSISDEVTREVEAWRGCCDEEREGTRRWTLEKQQEVVEREKEQNNEANGWA